MKSDYVILSYITFVVTELLDRFMPAGDNMGERVFLPGSNKNSSPEKKSLIRAMSEARSPEGKKRYSQKEIAECHGITQSAVSSWEQLRRFGEESWFASLQALQTKRRTVSPGSILIGGSQVDQSWFRSRRSFGGGSLIVWSAIVGRRKLRFTTVSGWLNSEGYQEMLHDKLLPVLEEGMIFQQDNASCHASRSTKDWLEAHGVDTCGWPSLSPDLNPIENVWGQLVRMVYKPGQAAYNTVRELEEAVHRAWAELSRDFVASCMHGVYVEAALCCSGTKRVYD
ncbi:hypothetical protein FOL47_007872 [Perkinsus chesapeaki]|uniref:Tc1-like transposase DDE domain-containing protein n=1 Tax=Perkinsus chesapeaki TaxID=330153 RepID=A0A7J6LHE7_PERCH|nr:hypothetical protein FOL47_007872 [Perkinsus chesapeaki]